MRVTLLMVFAVIGSMLLAAAAEAQPLSATAMPVATGLAQPLMVTHAPGDRSRVFIVEKGGRIKVLRDGVVLATPFLDISAQVWPSLDAGSLSVAFAPDFATTREFYVFYVRRPVVVDGVTISDTATVIARFRVTDENPDVADPASQEVVYVAPRVAGLHWGGWMGFGPDGLLYITVGDASGYEISQSLQSPHGKLLRMNPRGDDFPDDANRNFTVPVSNPFVATSDALPEIFARGLRNPWRASFDRGTGNLWIGDVGAGSPGEVDFIAAGSPGGQNFGWPCFDTSRGPDAIADCGGGPTLITGGLWSYSNSIGNSLTGGYVYRGCAIQAARGLYFFADYSASKVWTFPATPGTLVPPASVIERTAELRPANATNFIGFSAFGEDADGELYLCNERYGIVYKIVPAPGTFRDANSNGVPDWCEPPFCGAADVAGLGGTPAPDNQLTSDDVVAYLAAFFAGNLAVADLSSLGGAMQPDGQLTPDDLIAFLGAFFTGCE